MGDCVADRDVALDARRLPTVRQLDPGLQRRRLAQRHPSGRLQTKAGGGEAQQIRRQRHGEIDPPGAAPGVEVGVRRLGCPACLQYGVALDPGPLRQTQFGCRDGKGEAHDPAFVRGQTRCLWGKYKTVGDEQAGYDAVQPCKVRLGFPIQPLRIDRHFHGRRGVAQQRKYRARPGRLHDAGSVGRRGIDHEICSDDGSGVWRRGECQLQARLFQRLDLGPNREELAACLEIAIEHEVKERH